MNGLSSWKKRERKITQNESHTRDFDGQAVPHKVRSEERPIQIPGPNRNEGIQGEEEGEVKDDRRHADGNRCDYEGVAEFLGFRLGNARMKGCSHLRANR